MNMMVNILRFAVFLNEFELKKKTIAIVKMKNKQ